MIFTNALPLLFMTGTQKINEVKGFTDFTSKDVQPSPAERDRCLQPGEARDQGLRVLHRLRHPVVRSSEPSQWPAQEDDPQAEVRDQPPHRVHLLNKTDAYSKASCVFYFRPFSVISLKLARFKLFEKINRPH